MHVPPQCLQGSRKIEFIANTRKRGAAFCKRREGLTKKFTELCRMTQCEGLLIVRSPTGCLFKTGSGHLLPLMRNQALLDAVARALPPPLPRFVRSPEAVARRQRRREARLAALPHAYPHPHMHSHPTVIDVLDVPPDPFPEPLDIPGDPLDFDSLLGG